MAWEEESIQLEVSDSGGKKNKIKLILIGVGALVGLSLLVWLGIWLFSSEPEPEPEKPVEAKKELPVEKPVETPDEPVGDGTRIDLERFVVHLQGGTGAGYLVFDASVWVKGEVAQVLVEASPDEPLIVNTRQALFLALSGLTREQAQDEGELRELGARLRAPLAEVLGKADVTQVLIKSRPL